MTTDSSPVRNTGREIRSGDSLPSLSVVICAYTDQRWDDLVAAVSSVRAQTRRVHEIVVVIDHNERLEGAAKREFTDAIVTTNSEQAGLSGARNSGLRTASGNVVAFLDDDAAAAPDWSATLLRWYRDPLVIAVGGRSKPQWSAGRPGWFPPEFDWVVGCSYRGMPTAPAVVRNMIGSNMSFRSDVFQTVGGFDHRIGRVGANPVGCEETEFCIRAVAAYPGARILYDPAAVVLHTVSPQRGTWTYFRARCFAEGQSKAIVAGLVGSNRGLATERRYVLRTLPRGVLEGVAHGVTHRRPQSLRRAAAIVAGFALTAGGYAFGRAVALLQPARRGRGHRGGQPAPSDG